MISEQLQKKIDQAIRLLQATAPKDGSPVEIAYSGGKDSDVILQLAKEAGIKYRAIYKNTTIDPPGTIRHAEEMGAEIVRPKESFFKLVEKKGYPTRMRRFCCEVLKEYQYDKALTKVVIGVRREESTKRAKRYNEPTECKGTQANPYEAVYPVLDWTTEDVSEFLQDRGVKCAPRYYDCNGEFHPERRLGCMCCPITYKKKRVAEFKETPGMVKAYIRAGQRFIDSHPDSVVQSKYADVYEYFYRNIFCDAEDEFNQVANGLFGKPNFKAFLEDYFKIKI